MTRFNNSGILFETTEQLLGRLFLSRELTPALGWNLTRNSQSCCSRIHLREARNQHFTIMQTRRDQSKRVQRSLPGNARIIRTFKRGTFCMQNTRRYPDFLYSIAGSAPSARTQSGRVTLFVWGVKIVF